VSPVRYELGLYILEDGILHTYYRENLNSYIALTGWALYRRRNISPVRYELGFYLPEGGILQSPPWKPQILHSINRLGCVAETMCLL
jgi:hypothetical protein